MGTLASQKLSGNESALLARPDYLEGLRGIAAWMVVLHHLVFTFFPILNSTDPGQLQAAGPWTYWIAMSPLNQFYGGHYAVLIFFVLSGFVLSFKTFTQPEKAPSIISSSVIRRYPRLAFPAAASIFLSYLLLRFGIYKNLDVYVITQSQWLGSQFLFPPDFLVAMKQGFYDIFFRAPVTGSIAYNSSLWSIGAELTGSFLVFAFLAFFSRLKHRWIFYIVAAFLFFNNYYFCFVMGMALCDLYVINRARKSHPALAIFATLFGVFLGAVRSVDTPLYHFLGTIGLAGYLELVQMIGAAITLWGITQWRGADRVLANSFFRPLGKTSYAVYLVHIPVIFSVGCGTFLYVVARADSAVALWCSFFATFASIYGIALLFKKWVDDPSINLGHRFFGWVSARGEWIDPGHSRVARITSEFAEEKELKYEKP